ncbi:putative ABC transporter permease [Treponema vincentii]|uniref:putative ABC transporter permease n=1 Tax=Treponema vincentii TaxID=69710 RepID=UPI001E3CF792|nr:putative ABC transporter permease [Treponema vincentii]
MPLNLNGRTSVITSIGFGLGSIIIMKYLIPLYERAFAPIPDGIIIALSVVLVAIHSSDITLTVSRLTNFQSNIDEMEGMFQDKMTLTVDKLFERRSKLYGKTLSRIASFKMSESHNMIAERIIKAMHDSKRVK